MDKTYNMGGGGGRGGSRDVEEEDDDEKLILDSSGFSKKLAERIRGFGTLTELLQFLVEDKPADLKCGREHYLNTKELGECMAGLSLKLKIHGYDDRGDRLKYLHSVLSSKLAHKEDVFKIITQFLIEMSQRPTSVTHLAISSEEYSYEPDEDSTDDDSEKQKALLRLILAENDDDEDPFDGTIMNPSDSELSEWSTDEEASIEEKSNNDVPPIRKVRHSSSFGEFSDITESKPDPEKLKQEIKLYWSHERTKAELFLQEGIRKFNTVTLSSQPVISSLLVLQSRFGEFWEWKKCSKQKSELLVAFEEDIVREILWQFNITSPESSPLFTHEWLVKPNLMIATTSKSSFSTLINKYGSLLCKLQALRKFSKSIEQQSLTSTNEELPPPSKVYRNYAAGLQQVSLYVTGCICRMERELKRVSRHLNDGTEPACTTLIQLERKTHSIFNIIDIVYEVHSRSVTQSESVSEPWFTSIQLISCLETHLLLQTKPRQYGVLLFLFSKCLTAILDDMVSALKTMKWNEKYTLFVRDVLVRLNDSSFWTDCIKVRPYHNLLAPAGISPIQFLDKLLPKVLNILKTCEVLNQLEEDTTRVLGKSYIDVNDVVHEFLHETLFFNAEKVEIETNNCQLEDEAAEYKKHFSYIGLGNSFVADSFRFLTASKQSKAIPRKPYKFEDFVNITDIPIVAHTVILDKVLSKWFNPFSFTAKENIQKIFQDYKVVESLTVFQEIILSVREDFARAVIEIASDRNKSEEYKYEDNLNRNPKYQKLLNDCYPEGRECFTVDLQVDTTSDTNYAFQVTPHFPLNLIVTPESVGGYLFIGKQLHRIRKSLWDVSSLHMKDCKPGEGVDVTRLLMFRFCLINFCSSIRTFFTLKLFSKDFSEFATSASYEDDLDSIRRIHEDYLKSIETRMLRNPVIENVIIKKLSLMSEGLRRRWCTGISQSTITMLEDILKKCWKIVNDFQGLKSSYDFNELSFHFGPPPTCL